MVTGSGSPTRGSEKNVGYLLKKGRSISVKVYIGGSERGGKEMGGSCESTSLLVLHS